MMAQPSSRSRVGEGALRPPASFRIQKTAPALEALYDDASLQKSPSLVNQLAEASRDVTLRIRAGPSKGAVFSRGRRAMVIEPAPRKLIPVSARKLSRWDPQRQDLNLLH